MVAGISLLSLFGGRCYQVYVLIRGSPLSGLLSPGHPPVEERGERESDGPSEMGLTITVVTDGFSADGYCVKSMGACIVSL